MHQSPRAAAVACRKNLKATAADCYDFAEMEAESWRPAAPASASASTDTSTDTSASTGTKTRTSVSNGLRVEMTYGSRESRHSRHVIQY